MLDAVKLALRISNSAYDIEISDLIAEAKADMGLCGLASEKIVYTDILIKRAIITYCKANFGLNNADSARLQLSYEAIRNHLSMSIDYIYYVVTINETIQGIVTFDGEIKQTNVSGVAIFYTKAKNHIAYTLIDNIVRYIDVTADVTIEAVI